MKRHILLIVAVLFSPLCVMSEVLVSAEEAQNAAVEYYKKLGINTKGECRSGAPEKFSLLGKADMWLVPVNDNWILVSSDKRTEAILARFTHPTKPDLKSFPPQAQYLISCYEHDIAYVQDTCKDCHVRDNWEKQPVKSPKQGPPINTLPSFVEPLLGDIAWNQYGNESWNPDCEKVYNKFCPPITTNKSYLCGHAVAGCVAVAIAQIMRYWEWPYMADIPTTVGGSIKETHFFGLEASPPWLSNYSTELEVALTAGFLRDCGYDLGMSYGESSGATDAAAVNTFIHFGYNPNTIHNQKKWYTSGWTNILRSEIAAGHPVYYSGRTAGVGGSGHAFILDGYDASGLYHVNLGWGPYYNDYYFIDTITAGGSSYSHWQGAIWGIQPDSTNFCSPVTVTMPITNPYWGIARAGAVTLDGVVMNNNANCRVYSSTEVHLTNGTEIRNGSYVNIAIRNIPCSSIPRQSPMPKAEETIVADYNTAHPEKKEDFSVTPNPAKDVIHIHTNLEVTSVRLYNTEGSCLIKSTEKELHITHLPTGVYLLRVETTDGIVKQTKVLHVQ